ncbi:hypothetical protein ACIBI9_14540 [Nonomuraea sp. NPDC050451]|uniref:hypothetical protein n=1 Tax=Nonomuraea sp. NPDC050451 TaxID=3364364 RepID=UPI00378A4365
MAPSRSRVLIMAGILGLVAVLGIAWLAGVATGNGAEPLAGTGTNAPADAPDGSADAPDADGSTDAPDDDGSATGVPGDSTGQGKDADGGQPTGDRSTPPPGTRNNRRSVHWNGVHLDGSPGDDGCVTIINKTSTVGTIESVSFTVQSGPGRATARSAPGHCDPTGDPLCQGVLLRAGSQCLAGAIITGDASDRPYVIQAVVRFRYLCVNVEDAPCDEVRDWGGPPPTAEAPVEVSGQTSNNVPRFDYYIGDSGTSPEESPTPSPDDDTGPSTDDSGSSQGDSDSGSQEDSDPGSQDDEPDPSDDGTTAAPEGE